MTLLGEDEFRQPVIAVQAATSQVVEPELVAPEPAPMDAVTGTPENSPQSDAADSPSSSPLASAEISAPSALAATSSAGAAGAPPPPVETPPFNFTPYSREQDYLIALREAVRSQWAPGTGSCSVTIQQTIGGRVVAAVSESCAMGAAARQALEAAALAAQPLPYAGFERVFRERVTINMGM
jgi:hypothetical protein